MVRIYEGSKRILVVTDVAVVVVVVVYVPGNPVSAILLYERKKEHTIP